MTRRDSLRVCDRWHAQVAQNRGQRVVVAVGNKADRAGAREVSREDAARHFAGLAPPVRYFETSAKTGEGVQALFEGVAGMVVDEFSLAEQNENTAEGPQQQRTTGGCAIC